MLTYTFTNNQDREDKYGFDYPDDDEQEERYEYSYNDLKPEHRKRFEDNEYLAAYLNALAECYEYEKDGYKEGYEYAQEAADDWIIAYYERIEEGIEITLFMLGKIHGYMDFNEDADVLHDKTWWDGYK